MMTYNRQSTGSYLKEIIMYNEKEINIPMYNKDLYSQAHIAADFGNLNVIKKLIQDGLDLSHPYIDQPECLLVNVLYLNNNWKHIKIYLDYIIDHCIDVNAICTEFHYCLHKYNNIYIKYKKIESSSYNYAITLLDYMEIMKFEYGTKIKYIRYIIKMLKKNGAKSGKELGYTKTHANRLLKYKYINYDYKLIKESNKELHLQLDAYMFKPKYIEKYINGEYTLFYDNIHEYCKYLY